jgi:hypothetical protein
VRTPAGHMHASLPGERRLGSLLAQSSMQV